MKEEEIKKIEKDKQTIASYRKVFDNAAGRAVFADIMHELGFMSAHLNGVDSRFKIA